MATTTFQTQSFGQRAQKAVRLFQRMQYPLSENSEPMFDLERYGNSSRHSSSTRRSVSTYRRGAVDEDGRPISRMETGENENDKVDIVVVDHQFEREPSSSDEHEGLGEKQTTLRGTEHGSTQDDDQQSTCNTFLLRGFYYLQHFFHPVFQNPKKETHYQKESWFLAKRVAIWISVFYYISWALLLGLYPRPWKIYDYIAWLGVIGLFVIPILPAVLFDVPKRYPWSWRIFLFFTTWVWSFLMILQLVKCHFYGPGASTCGQKDFVGLFFYLVAMPTMALFALQQSRLLHLAGTLAGFLSISIAILPLKRLWLRHLFNFLAFQIFVLYISYAREKSDRKIFNLRDQLKVQYKATQKAQVAESKASDSKKRFFNYIFHEVRVPLNTALLSVQNLVGEDVFKDTPADTLELVDVLQSSLAMMEKVLNDVLDFHRSSEAGKLTYASAPFEFNKVIHSVLMGLDVAAVAKNVNVTSDLDPRIEVLGEIVGDEMRLRQVLSNLVSNACKFTGAGGSVSLTTKLISISSKPTTMSQTDERSNTKRSSDSVKRIPGGSSRSDTTRVPRNRSVTIRVEISDTGCGIKPSDVKHDKLFSPYVQTEIGKRQGGKGTGLGLALVRNIIELSGGRLGLQSKPGEGSTFWVEQHFDLFGPPEEVPLTPISNTRNGEQTSAPATSEITNKLSTSTHVHVQEKMPKPAQSPEVREITSAGCSDDTPIERPTLPATPPATSSTIGTLGNFPRSERSPSQHTIVLNPIPVVGLAVEATAVSTATDVAPPNRRGSVQFNLDKLIVAADEPLHILVIDDDLLTRRLMSRMLTRLGHSVESTENGLLALDIIRKHWRGEDPKVIDLIFCDNQMPVLSGVEMVNLARMEGINTMLCGVTGNAMQEDQDEFLDCGADHVLIKPVLEAHVKEVIEKARKRKAGIYAKSL